MTDCEPYLQIGADGDVDLQCSDHHPCLELLALHLDEQTIARAFAWHRAYPHVRYRRLSDADLADQSVQDLLFAIEHTVMPQRYIAGVDPASSGEEVAIYSYRDSYPIWQIPELPTGLNPCLCEEPDPINKRYLPVAVYRRCATCHLLIVV